MKKIVFWAALATLSLAVFAQNQSEIDTANVRPKHEFSLFVTPDYANLFYKGVATQSFGLFNVGVGLDYTFWFHRNVGVSIGAKWQRYSGVYKFADYQQDIACVDYSDPLFPEGDLYNFHGEYNQKETQMANYIEVPIKVAFAAVVSKRTDFRAAIGFNPGFCVAGSQKMDNQTSYRRTAQFFDGFYEIDDLKSAGIGTFDDFSGPYGGKLFSHSFGIVADLGFAFAVNENWRLHAGVTGGYGFNDVRDAAIKLAPKTFHDVAPYRGVMVTDHITKNGVHTLFAGMMFGVSYALGNKVSKNTTQPEEQKLVEVVPEQEPEIAKIQIDTDSDGVPDEEDRCPQVAGLKSNFGCPELTRQVKKLFRKAMHGIEFETNGDKILESSYAILDEIVQMMNENPGYLLFVSGHSDNVGKPEYNQKLSERRAASVRNYLCSHGVEQNRITSQGFGDTKPIASNDTEAGRAKNRRTEFEVIYETIISEQIINPELHDLELEK